MVRKIHEHTQNILLIRRQIFNEHGRVHDKIAAATESKQGNEYRERDPVRRRASNDGEDGAEEERDVEREPATDDICAQAPEQSAAEHPHVDGNVEGAGV